MRLTPILFILFILSGLWSGSIQAAAPVSVLVDPSTYVLIRPTSAQLAAANNLGGGGGGGSYIFTAADFNESGSTISIDFTNGQKATSLIPGYLTAADWITFNAKAPTASPTFTGTPIAPTAAADTNTTQIATTAFVIGQGYLKSATASSTYQGLDSDLTSIAALATTAFGRGLLAETSASTLRTTLSLVPGTNFLPYPSGTPTGSKFLRDDNSWVAIAGGGDALVANPLSQFAATTSAQLAGVLSDEAGASGGFVRSGYLGTAATEAATAFQPADADLTTYANITPSANVQSLLGAADYSAMRTQLSLVPGTNVQAFDADLSTYAGITPSANTQTFLGAANYAAMRTQLGLVISTDVQAFDSDLTTWGGVTPGSGVPTFLTTPSSANLAAAITDETGTGAVVLATSPTFPGNLTITGNATPATTTAGTLSFDTNAWATSRGSFQAYDGTANIILLGALASDTPSNGQVPTWNTGGTITWENAGTGNVTNNATLASGNLVLGGGTSVVGTSNITVTGGNNITLGNLTATTLNATAVSGATANGQLLIGNVTSGNFVKAVPTASAGASVTLGAGTIEIGSTDVRNIIVGNTTVTSNSTGNVTLTAGDNIVLSANNTTKAITINATGSGSGAETGDVKFILDSASVPSGWALTGVNGIPAYTGHDADYKPVIKMAGTVATPTFSPAAGAVASGTTITFSSATSGVTFMTTNNTTDPGRSVGTAGGTWTISANQTIEVMAYKDGAYLIDSAVASAAYTLTASGPALVAEVGAGAASGGDGFTTGSINTTGANLIVAVKVWYGATEPALSDSNTNSYTAAGAAQSDLPGDRKVRHYYVYGGTVGSGHTFTLGGTAHYGSLAVMAFSGMASSPVDQNNGDEETSWTTLPSGSITPTQANTVSVTGLMYDSGSGAVTEPTGYTAGPEVAVSSGAHVGVSAAWKILSATTTINPDWTASTSYLYGASKHVNYKY
jgi:hypothetical protein